MDPKINAFNIIALSFFVLCITSHSARGATEEEAIVYLEGLDPRFSAACNLEKQARWDYVTNITAETLANSVSKLGIHS